jgi:hypothetical protein
MTRTLVALYVVLACVAAVVYPEELDRRADRWGKLQGPADVLVLVLAVVLWPGPLVIAAWYLARKRYRTWRNPVPATSEELHDER